MIRVASKVASKIEDRKIDVRADYVTLDRIRIKGKLRRMMQGQKNLLSGLLAM